MVIEVLKLEKRVQIFAVFAPRQSGLGGFADSKKRCVASRACRTLGKLARDGHFSFVFSGVDRLFAMTIQQPAFVTHHPVNPLVVDPAVPFQPQASPDAAVAVGGAVLDHIGNGLIDDSVIIARR